LNFPEISGNSGISRDGFSGKQGMLKRRQGVMRDVTTAHDPADFFSLF
jgi:hypothetical protein